MTYKQHVENLNPFCSLDKVGDPSAVKLHNKYQISYYFERSGKAHQIQYYLWKAADILPNIDEVFDLVFIDADKRHNALYYEIVVDRVRAGGLIIVDNVLWGGKVLFTTEPVDPRTQSIQDFNSQVHRDPRVANLLLPLRDGLMILRKK